MSDSTKTGKYPIEYNVFLRCNSPQWSSKSQCSCHIEVCSVSIQSICLTQYQLVRTLPNPPRDTVASNVSSPTPSHVAESRLPQLSSTTDIFYPLSLVKHSAFSAALIRAKRQKRSCPLFIQFPAIPNTHLITRYTVAIEIRPTHVICFVSCNN